MMATEENTTNPTGSRGNGVLEAIKKQFGKEALETLLEDLLKSKKVAATGVTFKPLFLFSFG